MLLNTGMHCVKVMKILIGLHQQATFEHINSARASASVGLTTTAACVYAIWCCVVHARQHACLPAGSARIELCYVAYVCVLLTSGGPQHITLNAVQQQR
jgi:hypothetical protein